MHPSIQRELPEFLIDSIAYCDNLTYKKNERSCFVLAKNLKFYEFRRKQLLHSIDLSETCLAALKERLMFYDGRKCKWFGDPGMNETTAIQSESSDVKANKFDIQFGKYIYRSFDVSKLYLLLLCWNKLIVIQRLADMTTSSFRLIAEYENVAAFRVVPSTVIKFQAAVKVQFRDGNYICTDFEAKNAAPNSLPNTENKQQQRSEFKKLLERVRHTKAELQFHKEITQKQFRSLKNKQSFGSNFLRSTKLDEKSMLSRCGDVWIRISSQDELVIGLPLVNNCSPPNLTILKNLQPVLNVDSISLSYDYRIYQLQQTFENLESLETFFQSEDVRFEQNIWIATDAHQIRPASFVVLLVKFRLSQLMLIDGKCQFFVRFHIEKNLEMDVVETHTFEQHLFIKTIDFQEVLHQRQAHEIKFNESTIHQDFLALAMTQFETQLEIHFATCTDQTKFEQLVALKFEFEIVHREEESHEFNGSVSIEMDESTKQSKRLPCTLFYNRKPSSLWFGALIMRASELQISNDLDNYKTAWTFYNKNEEKAFLMFKLLFSELITLNCNVIDIKHGQQCHPDDSKIVSFENAMRQEIAAFLNIANNDYDNDTLNEKMKLLMHLQYNTDILALQHCQNFV